jgi:peptide/nickel transport system permease protein
VITRHLVPNVSNTVVTAVTLQIPTLLVIEATLSYLGFVPGSARTWGNLIAIGLRGFPQYWWVVVPPVVVLFLTAVAFNVVGDALRDVLDPRGGESA